MIPIKYIIQGWWNLLLDFVSDIKYKEVFDGRMEICNACEKNEHGICSVCHCVLKAKTKAEGSECPEGKWGPINTESEKV